MPVNKRTLFASAAGVHEEKARAASPRALMRAPKLTGRCPHKAATSIQLSRPGPENVMHLTSTVHN